jgi:hypothetical protein
VAGDQARLFSIVTHVTSTSEPCDERVEPLLRVVVASADFPLREDVLAAPDGFNPPAAL